MSERPVPAVGALRQRLNPFLRGSLFYGAYWGAVGLFQPFQFVYFANLGISSEQIGILSSIYSLCVLFVSPLVSRLADRYNRHAIALGLCLAGYGVLLMGLQAVHFFLPLVVLYLGMNIFHAPVSPLADSMIVRMSFRWRLNYGGMRMWGSLVFAVTSAVFGWVWEQVGFHVTFLLSGIMMLLVAGSALLLDESEVLDPNVSGPGEASNTLPSESVALDLPAPALTRPVSIWQDGRFLLLLAALFLIGATFSMGWTFESLFVVYLGGTRTLIGGMMGLSALAELPPMQFGQRILRRLGDFNSLLLSFFLLSLSYFGYWMASGTWSILLVNIIKGLGFGLFFISVVVIVDRRAPAGLASTYQGLMAAVTFGLAPIIAGPLGGWIYATFEPRTLFLLCGVLVLVAMLVLVPAFANRTTK